MTKSKRFQPWRRLVRILEAAVVVGIPFLRVQGESALRFDIPDLQLHLFGLSLWMEEFFIVLVGIIFITFLFVLITVLLGRVWCGWVCPQTVLNDLTHSVDKTAERGFAQSIFPWAFTLLLSIVVAANLVWYFVSPYDFFTSLFRWQLGKVTWGFWISLTGILFLNFIFVRHRFCRTVCPYAKLQGALYDSNTLTIAFNEGKKKECIECLACVRTCPVGIDVRQGLSDACINCAECIDRCAEVMEQKGKRSLIGYVFGSPGERMTLLRPNAVMITAVTLMFLAYFLYLLFLRVDVDVTVLPNHSFVPRITQEGRVVNAYIVSLKNRGKKDIDLEVSVSGIGEEVRIIPAETVHLKAGASKKVPVYVSVNSSGIHQAYRPVRLIVSTAGQENRIITEEANFVFPEK